MFIRNIRRVSFFEKVHIDYPFSSVEVLNIFSVATAVVIDRVYKC